MQAKVAGQKNRSAESLKSTSLGLQFSWFEIHHSINIVRGHNPLVSHLTATLPVTSVCTLLKDPGCIPGAESAINAGNSSHTSRIYFDEIPT